MSISLDVDNQNVIIPGIYVDPLVQRPVAEWDIDPVPVTRLPRITRFLTRCTAALNAHRITDTELEKIERFIIGSGTAKTRMPKRGSAGKKKPKQKTALPKRNPIGYAARSAASVLPRKPTSCYSITLERAPDRVRGSPQLPCFIHTLPPSPMPLPISGIGYLARQLTASEKTRSAPLLSIFWFLWFFRCSLLRGVARNSERGILPPHVRSDPDPRIQSDHLPSRR